MADRKFNRPGTNRGDSGGIDQALFHDNGDGTYDLAESSHLRGWNTDDLTWDRLLVDPETGALLVSSSGDSGSGAASSGSVVVTSGSIAITSGTVTVESTVDTAESQVIFDNAGFTDGSSAVFPAGYIFDEIAGTALTENDAAAARVDSKRAQVFTLEDATTRGRRAAVATTGGVAVGGDVAHDTADSGNPAKVGGKAADVLPTSVAAGDRVNAYFDLAGKQHVVASTDGAGADVFSNNTIAYPWTGGGGGSAQGAGLGAVALWGLNRGTGAWDRVTVANTGRLQVDVGGASVTVTDGSVTATNTGFKVVDAGGTNQASVNTSGQVLVNVGNAPSVTVTSGSVTATNSGFKVIDASGVRQASVNTSGQVLVSVGNAPSVSVTSGSISVSNAPSVTVTSGSITATNTGFKVVDAGGTNQASVNTSGEVFVQQAYDTGRTLIHLYADRTGASAGESLMTMTRISGAASLATSTGYTVTTGKTFRIQEWNGFVVTNTTTGLNSRMKLRGVSSGNVTSVSTSLANLDLAAPAAVAQVGASEDRTFPDGLEIPAGWMIGVTHLESAATGSVSFSIVGFEY